MVCGIGALVRGVRLLQQPGVPLAQRYLKQKDMVENYLAWRVRHGEMDLGQAQRGIASNWTQYLADAKRFTESFGN
jgi:hypothetical protein